MRYAALMHRLFEQTQLDHWQGTARTPHFEVDGTIVGLIPKGDSGLVVYVDLGHQPGNEIQLLEYNARANDEVSGCFVVVPNSGKVAYRFDVPLDELERTPSLPAWLQARVNQARTALASA